MSKTTIYILIATLIVLASWLGFEIYHQSRETTLPEIVQEQFDPIDPNLPIDFIDDLEARQENRVGNKLKF